MYLLGRFLNGSAAQLQRALVEALSDMDTMRSQWTDVPDLRIHVTLGDDYGSESEIQNIYSVIESHFHKRVTDSEIDILFMGLCK